MFLRFAVILVALNAASATAQGGGRTIDEGTFAVSVAGAPAHSENFKITRGDNRLITATGHVIGGPQQITSSLTTDSVGTPVKYELAVREKGAVTLRVTVAALPGRLTAMSSNQRGDDSMRDYPLAAGRTLILDDGMLHELFFFALAKHSGPIEVIAPRESRGSRATLATKGLEPIAVAGRSITATHYSLGEGAVRREFWVDAEGRLLRVEIPAQQLVATREEAPR